MTRQEREAIEKVLKHHGYECTNEAYKKFLNVYGNVDFIETATSIGKVRCYKLKPDGKPVEYNGIPYTQYVERQRAEEFPHHWKIIEDKKS